MGRPEGFTFELRKSGEVVIDVRVGQVARDTYTRASRALHVGAEQEEVRKVLLYVQAVLNGLIPRIP